jgi:hypothetical protein
VVLLASAANEGLEIGRTDGRFPEHALDQHLIPQANGGLRLIRFKQSLGICRSHVGPGRRYAIHLKLEQMSGGGGAYRPIR